MRGCETAPLGEVARIERVVVNLSEVQKDMAHVGLEHGYGGGTFVELKAVQRASLAQLDALFASLQHQAFRGAP